MKVFRLPESTGAIFFDMDGTLYSHGEYLQSQLDLPVERLARLQGKTFDQMSDEISAYRKKWASDHDGASISLGNIMLNFGISIEETIKWREELFQPENYLSEDKQLRTALLRLSSRFTLCAVTNNPVSVAQRTFKILGVQDIFQKIVGLDSCRLSKPDKNILLKAVEICKTEPQNCVSVGDRYDIDIAMPLELSMGGILVDGVEDVYKLPDLFSVPFSE